jgi:hypothetical protein
MRYNRFATEPKKTTPGWSRKEDVQEKYDSGQVAEYEKNKQELDAQVQELFDEFIELFTDEKETLKKFIELTPTEENTSNDELTEDDEYRIFLSGVMSEPPKFKNLNHQPYDSDAVKKKKDQVRKVLSDESTRSFFRLLLDKVSEEEFKKTYLNGEYRNASLRKRAALDKTTELELVKNGVNKPTTLMVLETDSEDVKVAKNFIKSILADHSEILEWAVGEGDETLSEEYFTIKKDILGDLSNLDQENKKIDQEIEKEVLKSHIENTEIPNDEKEVIKQNILIDMNSEKHERNQEEEKEEKEEEKEEEPISYNLTHIDKLLLKKVGVENLPLDYTTSLTEEQKKTLLSDKNKTSKKFINIVKDLTKKKYDLPYIEGAKEVHKKVDFAEVCFIAITEIEDEITVNAAKKIVANKTDVSKMNNWNWIDIEYCVLQYKTILGSDLTEYEQVLKDIFIDQGINTFIKAEKEEKKKIEDLKEESKKFTDRIKEIKTKYLSGNAYRTSRLSKSIDEEVVKERESALNKKQKGEDLNLLDQFYIERIELEEKWEASYKLRVNKGWIENIQKKLSKGTQITDKDTLDSIKENIDDNTVLTLEEKEALKLKIDNGEILTETEISYIDPAVKALQRQPLSEKEIEILKNKVDNSSDKEKITKLKNNPEAVLATNKKELSEAKKKQTQKKNLTDFEKELLHHDKVVKEKAKADAPLSKLSIFIEKCKKDPKIHQFFQKALCANKVKDFDSYQKKVLHEVYSMIANESKDEVVARNKDRIKFLIGEATKECNMRDKRQNLHETLAKYKDADGATLLDFLPNNMIVEVDDTGTINKLFSMYDNKLSDLKDKIDIQENLMDKFELVKDKIYFDLKQKPSGDPTTDSESYMIVKKNLLSLIAAIALETGLRPAPVKNLKDELGEDFGDEAGGMSYKKTLKKDLTDEGKKQYEKNLIETYGIATLKPEHIKFFEKSLSANLKFYGKRGVENASKLTQPELVKELEKLVNVASGNIGGPKSLFVLPNGKLVNNTDIVVYFESLAHKAGLKRLKITDFRKLKAVSTIHQSLLQQQGYLYKQIAKLKAIETEAAKVKIAELVMETVDKAYKDAQKALSHSSVNETINSYVNPKLLLNFLSSGGVETAIEKALESKTSLKFDPEVFMVQALAYTGVDLESAPNSLDKKDQAILDKTEDNIFKKILTMGKEFLSKFARK